MLFLLVVEYDEVLGGQLQLLFVSRVVVIESVLVGWVGVVECGELNQILLDEFWEIWFDSLLLLVGLSFSEMLEDVGVELLCVVLVDVESVFEVLVIFVDNFDGQVVDEVYELLLLILEFGYSVVVLYIEVSLLWLFDGLFLLSSYQFQVEVLWEWIDGSLNWYELVLVFDDLVVLVLFLVDSGQCDFEEYLW